MKTDETRMLREAKVAENAEEINVAVREVEERMARIEERHAALLATVKGLLRTVLDDVPRDLRKLLGSAKQLLAETTFMAGESRAELGAAQGEVAAVCERVGVDKPSQATVHWLAAAERAAAAAEDSATAAAAGVADAEKDMAAAVAAGEEVNESGHDVLDMESELSYGSTLANINRTLLRATNGAEQGLLAGGTSKARDAAAMAQKLDEALGRLEGEAEKVRKDTHEQAHDFSYRGRFVRAIEGCCTTGFVRRAYADAQRGTVLCCSCCCCCPAGCCSLLFPASLVVVVPYSICL